MQPRQNPLGERDRFLKALRDELLQFERRELEFRKQDRKQRAAEIGLPLADARDIPVS
ncbi:MULTISPECIES: hypothetical protein [Bradyrhizobium]|uniref:hypothetical protein n=1 Tax=Bradyrhizobium TaxID=374 RepID=UPI001557BD97|nr:MULTISPECIES: hypothetical protein [Bradyrhizobium]NPV19251.1 hypothetical protein [Bradyrhizobium aeschynomenes]